MPSAYATVRQDSDAWKIDALASSLRSKQNAHPLNERQRQVINRLLDDFQGFLTTSKYAKLAKCSTDTALRDIQQLLQHGILQSNPGRGRSASYRLVDDDAGEE